MKLPPAPERPRVSADPLKANPTAARLAAEGLVGLIEAVHSEGPRVSIWTAMRWCRHGLRDGTRLEAVKIGGRWYSSRPAVKRFMAQQAELHAAAPAAKAQPPVELAAASYLESVGLGRSREGGAK